MPLWSAILIFIAAAAGIVLSAARIERRGARIACICVCALAAVLSLVYIALTLILVGGVD